MSQKKTPIRRKAGLVRGLNPDDLRRYYWLKKELVQFCHQLGVPASGRKLEILRRIEVYLKTGKVLPPERIVLGAPNNSSASQADGRNRKLTLATPVVNFKSDQRTRDFFTSVIGPQFHFTAHLNQFMRGRHDLTYGDLVKEWLAERDRRKDKSYKPRIMKSGEYNQFIRDFFADPANLGKRLTDAVSSWERVKRLPGPRVYSSSRKPETSGLKRRYAKPRRDYPLGRRYSKPSGNYRPEGGTPNLPDSKPEQRRIKLEKFKGELIGGHKDAAIQVPFDPAKRWSIAATRLRPGRWGHHVQGSLNGTSFESVVVGRSRRFWLLVDDNLQLEAGVSIGDMVEVALTLDTNH